MDTCQVLGGPVMDTAHSTRADCVAVKEEYHDVGGFEESGFARSCCVPWPLLPSKVSNFPHFMPMPNPGHDHEKPLKMKSIVLPSFDVNKEPSWDFQNHGGNTTMVEQFHGDGSYLLTAPSSNRTSAVGDGSRPMTNSGSQFTIFYDGTIHVFDDFSPEKAQAIIFLAGNGCAPSQVSQSKYQMEEDNKPLSTSRNHSTNPTNSHAKLSPVGTFAANAITPSGVTQSRKASLARFLEKRRERATNALPYGTGKKPQYDVGLTRDL